MNTYQSQATVNVGNVVPNNMQPAGDTPGNPDIAWWCKLLTRGVATLGGVVSLIMGILVTISISPRCIIAGLLLIGGSLLLLLFEAPFCCQFFHYAKPLVDFADRRSFMQKAIIYVVLAIPPVAMCFGVTSLIGSALIFATGVLYGLMSLGKKADRETMLAQARAASELSASETTNDQVILVDSSK